MKPLIGMILSTTLVVALGCVVGCNSETSSQLAAKTNAQSTNLQSVTFYVDGMV